MGERCANTEALKAHERKLDKDEKIFEAMKEELVDELQMDYEDLHSRFDRIVKAHEFECSYNFEDFIAEKL
jgi:cyclopropane fatty-acyl-phospholipid synthase-like methyltransferase